MEPAPLILPLLRAAAWLEEDPGPGRVPAVADGFLDVAWGAPEVGFVDRLQRRRLSVLARGFCHCAHRLDPPAQARTVFASRHGEAARTLAVFKDLAAQAEVSPALFSLSVHNAVPGLWSILAGSRAPVSALAAGPETFLWGLVEALATYRAAPSAPVLFVFAEDRLPDPWADPVPRGVPHALALLLGEPAQRRLRLVREPGAGPAEPPLAPSLACLQTLGAGGAGAWAGPEALWRWEMTI
jgi:hypothetical protein